MDYKEKYKEARERCREFYNKLGNAQLKKEVEEIFPELGESEDERIRKAIKILVEIKENDSIGLEPVYGASYKEMIAWLEKQGEQKPVDESDVLMSLDEAIAHCKEKSCGDNACAMEHKQLEKWLIELKELKKQNPADNVEPKFKAGDCAAQLSTPRDRMTAVI